MKKKAQLSLQMIIVAALGLIVLVILAIIFKEHISSYAAGYKSTADNAIESAEGERCVSILTTNPRKCSDTPPSEEWTEVTLTKDKWSDCEDEKCYEKTS
jgi:hypothetical protein